MTQNTLIERYQNFRTERFLTNERKWGAMLPSWRSLHRRRILVVIVAASLAFAFATGIVCAFGVDWAPLLWPLACVAFLPSWTMLQIVSGRQGDAPTGTLDEWEVQQRNSARSIGLTVTQALTIIPAVYLIVGTAATDGIGSDAAYGAGLVTLASLLIGGCTPAMILGWTRPDSTIEDDR